MLVKSTKIPNVNNEDINFLHNEEIELLNNILNEIKDIKNSDPSRVESLLTSFIYHVRDHFLYEEQLMQESKSPLLECHREEHIRVQKLMFQTFKEYGEAKDYQLITRYFESEFMPWILNHIETMDSALAEYLLSGSKDHAGAGCFCMSMIPEKTCNTNSTV
jgi:hemerythrin